MAMISELKQLFGEWIAAVASAVHSIANRLIPRRQISIIEGDGDTFTAKAAPVKGAALPNISFQVVNDCPWRWPDRISAQAGPRPVPIARVS
jgi:general secretion pathway protein L